MKHVVTLTTSNPSHEHVALRRRQSTTNFMVEAADEQTAIFRATAHFKRLGHYIHEAKIFKKKEQLNELASNYNPSAFIDDSAAKAGLKRNAGESDADLVKRIAAAKGIDDQGIKPVFPELALLGGAANAARKVVAQAGSAAFDKLMKSTKDVETGLGNLGSAIVDKGTSAGRVVRDEILSHAVSLPVAVGLQAAANKASGKETNLGSIVQNDEFWRNNADIPGLSYGSRILNLAGNASKYAKSVADDVAANAIEKAKLATGKVSDVAADAAQGLKSVGSTANDVVATALEKIRAKNLVPGRIDLPTKTTERAPYTELEPAIAPKVDKPDVTVRTDAPGAQPQVKAEPQVKQDLVVGRADSTAPAKPELKPKVETQPKAKTDTPVKTKVDTPARPKPKRRFLLPSLGDRPDVDPGTLGQYRGLFPLYQFSDFRNMQESAPMNAIGRVLAKRKKNDKEDAEGEKNKINMEPKLGGKA